MIRIDVLPDDVLLEIFDSYTNTLLPFRSQPDIDAWKTLVHVCQRWRNLVLGSPRRLNLRLFCTQKTPARDKLDVWPALPLIIKGNVAESPGTDNIIAALRQSNRVREVYLSDLSDLHLEEVLAPMQVSFPELTDLQLFATDDTPSAIPDSFLGGSAPRLRSVTLYNIPFPGLPNLLLSSTHLIELTLDDIPDTGYISPEAMVALLSASPSLKMLTIEFESPQYRPGREGRSLPPLKRPILPALAKFHYKGVTEYLEDLVAFIDAPQLNLFSIIFFTQIDYDTRRLVQFINRTPKLWKRDAHVQFYEGFARFKLRDGFRILEITIPSIEPDQQLSSIEQVCNSSLHPVSMVENLYISHRYWQRVWKGDAIENTLWLQLFLPFTVVKTLYLSKEFAPGIAGALEELVGDRITEALPSLQNIFVEGPKPSGSFQENIGQFVAARQLSGQPVAISVWDKYSNVTPA